MSVENKKIFTPKFSAALAGLAIGTLAGGNIARNAIEGDPARVNAPASVPANHEGVSHQISVDFAPVVLEVPVRVDK